jgi:hypothetical protein
VMCDILFSSYFKPSFFCLIFILIIG